VNNLYEILFNNVNNTFNNENPVLIKILTDIVKRLLMLGDKNFNKKIIQFININFKNQKKVFHLKANPKQSNSAANKHEIKDLLSKSQMSLCVIINLLKVLFEINPNLINTEMIEDSLLVIRYLLMMSKDLYKKYI